MLTGDTLGDLGIGWRRPVATRGLATAQGVVYVADQEGLRAVHAASGRQLWLVANPRCYSYDDVAVAGDLLVVARVYTCAISFIEEHYSVEAFRPDSGAPVWRTGGYGAFGRLLVHGELVHTSRDGYVVVTLDLATGRERWETPYVEALDAPPMAVLGGRLYLARGDQLEARAPRSGRLIWQVALAAPGSRIVAADGMLLVSTGTGTDVRDATTGRLRRQLRSETVGAYSGGVAYTVRGDGRLAAWTVTAGSPAWTAGAAGEWLSGPLVAGDLVYTVSTEGLRVHRRSNGALVLTRSGVTGLWAVSDGRVYVSSGAFADARLVVLRLRP